MSSFVEFGFRSKGTTPIQSDDWVPTIVGFLTLENAIFSQTAYTNVDAAAQTTAANSAIRFGASRHLVAEDALVYNGLAEMVAGTRAKGIYRATEDLLDAEVILEVSNQVEAPGVVLASFASNTIASVPLKEWTLDPYYSGAGAAETTTAFHSVHVGPLKKGQYLAITLVSKDNTDDGGGVPVVIGGPQVIHELIIRTQASQ